MTFRHAVLTGAAMFVLAAGLQAQTATTKAREPGTATETTSSITGEVLYVEKNWLLTKMLPNGGYRWFNVQPGRQFNIDGQTKYIADLKPGHGPHGGHHHQDPAGDDPDDVRARRNSLVCLGQLRGPHPREW